MQSMAYYASVAGLWLIVGTAIAVVLIMRDASEKPQFRLGHSVWLCRECHRVYAVPTQRCPRGHTTARHEDVTEVIAQFATTRDWQSRHDPYATRLMFVDDPGDTAQLATLSVIFPCDP